MYITYENTEILKKDPITQIFEKRGTGDFLNFEKKIEPQIG
jgi:hypothetical protein